MTMLTLYDGGIGGVVVEFPGMVERVVTRWASSHGVVLGKHGPSKGKGPAKDMKNFLREVGHQKSVRSPLTGEDIKLSTLTNGPHRDDPASQKLLKDEFLKWKKSAPVAPEEPEATAPEEPVQDQVPTQEETPPEEPSTGVPDEEPPATSEEDDAPVPTDPADYPPDEDVQSVAGKPPEGHEPTDVNVVVNKIQRGEAPTNGEVRNSIRLVTDALRGGHLSGPELEKMRNLENWLRAIGGINADERDEKNKNRTGPARFLTTPQSRGDSKGKRPSKSPKQTGDSEDVVVEAPPEPTETDHPEEPKIKKRRVPKDPEDDAEGEPPEKDTKSGSFRKGLVRLAYTRADLRPVLLAILGVA